MRIIDDIKLDFSDVLIVPKRSKLRSRKDVDLRRKMICRNSGNIIEGIPIIASNVDHTGTFEIARVFSKYRCFVGLHKFYSPEEIASFYNENPIYRDYTWVTIGMTDSDVERFEKIVSLTEVKNLSIDVANGYTEAFVDFVKRIRDNYPEINILAGTVVTPEITEQLILSGADIVRVGLGSGSICITRKITGVGYPQLSAVIDCADAAHGLKGLICSDGGIQMPGDVGKAFGGGADFVMISGYFAGHDECLIDEIKEKDGKKYVKFYGMSSAEAMNKYYGGVADYRASEGKVVWVPYKGSIENTLKEILGGLRSTCTYVGALRLKELPKRTTFIRVNRTHNTVFGD